MGTFDNLNLHNQLYPFKVWLLQNKLKAGVVLVLGGLLGMIAHAILF